MQICFIWVKKFKNLENFGICLSNDFDFKFDSSRNFLQRVEKSPIPNLFGDTITSITGVLGINGAGKTNSLELICRVLTSREKLGHEYLMVFSVNGAFFCSSNLKQPITANFEISRSTDIDSNKEMYAVFFSNVFDKNYIDFGDGVADVSVNNKNNPRTLARLRDSIESDFINDVEFFHSREFKKLELQAPPRVEIKIEKFITRHNQTSRQGPVVPILNYLAETRKKNRGRGKLYLVRQTIQMGFLKVLLERDVPDERLIAHMLSILDGNPHQELEELIGELRECYSSDNDVIPWNSNFLLYETLTILFKLESFLDEMKFEIDDTIKGQKFIFSIDFEPSESFWYRHLACIIQSLRFGSISWSGVSSGQKAYLNLFSSIWNGVDRYRYTTNRKQSTLICIDEGDLYLHPEWQLEFVERLIKCLPELSEGTVQIVFTTHSPILISDLPNQCVVILNHEYDSCIGGGDQIASRHKTFAANLYDIYQYSFGLNQKRSGNLSSGYLREIFKLLDKKNLSQQDAESLRLALSVVDDDVIKFHIRKRVEAQ
ncbi:MULTISPECIES: AAA family ATPase [unclassified Pseudomonas]|uniref:AAA family ATPase n=1 Tax=unclassified Pseudomonas TaxID=196821 RepID=UPI001E64039B|nr:MULTISPECIES: AAA family ATPase [unclassified Pseudomonas]MCE0915830.1 ATP-binding protein [Pseudomonas sp. NMI760_13]MCP8632095.1 ATP-binding protein [Pseudomonas sp. DVZ6]MDD7783075.1 AAA family ATPase [Pseudomonas sp. DVZ24]